MKTLFTISTIAAGLMLAGVVHADKADKERTEGGNQTMIFGTDLIHQKVVNVDGREIGHVEELVVDPGNGKIKMVVVSMGNGFMGVGNKSVTIPWDKLHTSATTAGYQVVIDEGTVREAPVYFRNTYGEPRASAGLQTWHGTVVTVESIDKNNNDAPFNALAVRTDEGLFTIQAGRDWPTQKDQLNIRPGDNVVIKGFVTGIGDRRAIIAQEINDNGKTVQLSTEGLTYRETSREQPRPANGQ